MLVGDQVVDGQEHRVALFGVARTGPLAPDGDGDPRQRVRHEQVVEHVRLAAVGVHDADPYGGLAGRVDLAARLLPGVVERRPQRGMPPYQRVDRAFQARHVDPPVEVEHCGHVVRRAVREQPRPHPQPVLLWGERRRGGCFRRWDVRRSRPGDVEPGAQVGEGHVGTQQFPQRQPDAVVGE